MSYKWYNNDEGTVHTFLMESFLPFTPSRKFKGNFFVSRGEGTLKKEEVDTEQMERLQKMYELYNPLNNSQTSSQLRPANPLFRGIKGRGSREGNTHNSGWYY